MDDDHDALLAAFGRHLSRANNTFLPGDRVPVRMGNAAIGYVDRALAAGGMFAAWPVIEGMLVAADQAALDAMSRRLIDAGLGIWRDEAFDVRADEAGPVVATLDRGVLPCFGIAAAGVHLNGLVQRADGLLLWVARRAADKLLDPGKLDHLAAGGVSAGFSPDETLGKEAAEECGLAPVLTARATHVGTIRYVMARPEGLRRDVLHCYDLMLPADWVPVAHDGEVESFELWPIEAAYLAVRDGDLFKFNVNLVLIDLFLRRGLIDPASPAGLALRRGLDGAWSDRTGL